MKFLVLVALSFLAIANGRFVQDELVPTRWMDRIIPDDGNERIFGGEPAEIADFPYMIAYLDLTRGGFRCGSSAIGLHWVLTAAHCLEIMTPINQLQLRGGSTMRNTGGVLFSVQAYWMHPSYNTRLEYDIGLVRTPDNHPIVGTNIAFIPLAGICPDTQVCCDVCDGVSLLVSGWGRTPEGSTNSLNQLTAPVHEWNDCMRIWNRNGPSFVCKAVIDGRDTCSGDSGSPLVIGTGANRVQVAVVSFGTSVCGSGSPSVNIRVEHGPVRNWITSLSGI
ncbi:hypothetical protein ACKWTF_016445 [Chironomus riparius]